MGSHSTVASRRTALLKLIRGFSCLTTGEYTEMSAPASRWQTYRDLQKLRRQGLVLRFRNHELDQENKRRGSGAWYWAPIEEKEGLEL